MTFKSLTLVVTAFTLLIITEGKRCWPTSEPIVTKNEMNISGNTQIVLEEDLLSVTLEHADLEEVLKKISLQSDIKIDSNGPLKEKVTLEFVNLSLESGLKRLLKNQNYAFTYSLKMDQPGERNHYILSNVLILEKSNSEQRQIFESRAVPGETHPDPPIQNMSVVERPADLIKELLNRMNPEQQESVQRFEEIVKSSLTTKPQADLMKKLSNQLDLEKSEALKTFEKKLSTNFEFLNTQSSRENWTESVVRRGNE